MHRNAKTCLLNPGPITLTERVRQALLRADLCHREPEFAELQTDVRNRLAKAYESAADTYTAVLLTGSGTAAVEAMVASLVPHDGRALVVANGIYGERIAAMLKAHGKQYEVVRSEWTEPMNLELVQRKLAKDARFSHVIAVHHETTTGRLNDIAALGSICRRRQVSLLLDTVSSFAGEEIQFAAWNVEACAATANKCLHGAPGISFVLSRADIFERRQSGANSLYLDLFRHYAEQRKGYPAFTPAVHVLYALQEALMELEDRGGWRQRRQHYQTLSHSLRSGLNQLGFQLLLEDPQHYSSILSSFRLPPGLAFEDLYTALKRSGFIIYAGQQGLNGLIFRLAVMGDLNQHDIERLILEFAAIYRQTNAETTDALKVMS